MKTIAFLHREELTDLFLPMSKYIGQRMNVIHIAYSDKEARYLQQAGVDNFYNYTALISRAIDETPYFDPAVIKQIDRLIVENTEGRFTLNGSLQSDRSYALLSYDEALVMSQVHYMAWQQIFDAHKIDIMLHEPCSLFFNHLAAVMCRAQGGTFLWQCMVYPENDGIYYLNIANDDFSCPEVEHNVEFFRSHPDKIDLSRCEAFVDKFRATYDIFLDNLQPKTNLWNLRIKSLRRKISSFKNRNQYHRLKQNIEYWINKQNSAGDKLINLRNYKKYHICFEEPVEGEKYYYYSFHLEPEAVVLYLGGGLYSNQVKLIENIAAALPAGFYLYVKDHPHEFAYRGVDDFLRLIRIPNVRLIRSTIAGKLLIKNAVGIFTINGTAGFEALMLKKQVYCFGKSYYSSCSKVNYIHHIRDLQKTIYLNQGTQYEDDTEFMAFVNGYLQSLHKGMVDFFMDRAKTYNLNLEINARQIADDIVAYSQLF